MLTINERMKFILYDKIIDFNIKLHVKYDNLIYFGAEVRVNY